MENPNIVRVDSKGRILIPVNFRSQMGVEEGTEMIIVPDEENHHFKILPIPKDKTAEVRFQLSDYPGNLASISDVLSANDFRIFMSESKRMDEELMEWKIIVDLTGHSKGVDVLRALISGIEGVKSMEVVRK